MSAEARAEALNERLTETLRREVANAARADAERERAERLREFVEWVRTEFALDDRIYWPAKNELSRDDQHRAAQGEGT